MDLEVLVSSCNQDQIRMYNKNKILYCESPKCDEKCPINTSAYCQSYYNDTINDIKKNKCVCNEGWEGDFCTEKIFFDLIKIKNTVIVIHIPILFALASYILFITYYKNRSIIENQGFYKILILSLGLFLFLLSNCFVAYSNYAGCAVHFTLKYIGISLIFIIEYIYNALASKLGILSVEDAKFKFINSESTSNFNIFTSVSDKNIKEISTESKLYETMNDSQIFQEIEKKLNSSSNKRLSKKWTISNGVINVNQSYDLNNTEKSYIINDNNNGLTSDNNINKQKSMNNTNDEQSKHKRYNHIKRSIKQIHATLIEIYSLYPIYFCSIILLVVIYYFIDNNSNDNIIQTNIDGKWIYQCNIEDSTIIYNIINFFMLLVILINGKKNAKFECVFKCTKYITYSIYVGIVLGPGVSIVNNVIFDNQRYLMITFESILNSICYVIMFLLFSWDKIYYILINEGNNPNKYFIYNEYEKCTIHNSITCGCKLETKKQDNSAFILKYINFYKFCSTIFEFKDGRFRLINKNSKISVITLNDDFF